MLLTSLQITTKEVKDARRIDTLEVNNFLHLPKW